MSVHEHLTAELAWMRRRGLAAAPPKHPLRTSACPSLGAVASGRLSATQRRHVERCRHCRSVRSAAEAPRLSAAPAVGALAAAVLVGVWLSAWQGRAPARFVAPALQVVEPAPRAVEAEWPAPLRLRAPGTILPAPTTTPPLPEIRPLERFEPPEHIATPMPLAALGAPNPPALEPAPPPDVVGMLGLRIL